MAQTFRVAIIGCGRPWGDDKRTGSGMAHLHMSGYTRSKQCEVVALADIVQANAQAFAQRYEIEPAIYTDYKKMLKAERPDIVSICLWPHLHAPAVMACARAGVKAVHCEKPMAPTWGEARRMAAACDKSGTQLTFNHQRRFLPTFRRAKELINDGSIGDLVRLEGSCHNMIDWGTHWIDMMFNFNNETPVRWVIGQIDARERHEVFGLPFEHQAICQFMFDNGVRALLFTGEDADIGCEMRAVGTEGVVELRNEEPSLRLRGKGHSKWRTPKLKGGLHGGDAVGDGVLDLIDALETGREPELSVRRALQTTEVIFALYESSRRRGRVDLPLKKTDSAFLSMVESGDLKPKKGKKK